MCTQTFYCINKAHFLSFYSVVTLKKRSRSPKSNHFFPPSLWCTCARLVKFQPFVKEILCTQTFYCINKAQFLSIYNVVTLKIRPRSSKSNHFFPPSWWCICASVVKFNHWLKIFWLIVLGFNDTSTLERHFVSSPREREKRDRRESRGDEREGQGRKRNRNESEETEEIKTFPLYPYPLQG